MCPAVCFPLPPHRYIRFCTNDGTRLRLLIQYIYIYIYNIIVALKSSPTITIYDSVRVYYYYYVTKQHKHFVSSNVTKSKQTQQWKNFICNNRFTPRTHVCHIYIYPVCSSHSVNVAAASTNHPLTVRCVCRERYFELIIIVIINIL